MRRLTLSLLLVVLVAVIGLGWGLDEFYDHLVEPVPDENSVMLRAGGASFAKTFDSLENKKEFIDKWNENTVFTLSMQPLDEFSIPKSLHQDFKEGRSLRLESEDGISIHYYLPIEKKILTFALPKNANQVDSGSVNLVLTLIFYSGVILVILIWLYPLIRRLIVLRDTAKSFGEGKLESRVLKGKISFISDIENEFNKMAQRIQTLISDNKLLSSAVSHDLRTPLSRLRFGIETLAETYGDIEREKYINRIVDDLDEMESLVESLLAFARLDESRVKLAKTEVDLVKLLMLECDEYRAGKVSIQADIQVPQANINADGRFIKMLITNIVSNATQYANKCVRVSLRDMDSHYCLVVEDDGPGIPSAQREQIVKPFVRGETGQQKRGHGLGLAIVTRIIEWHDSELKILDSEELGGAKIEICFEKFSKQNITEQKA